MKKVTILAATGLFICAVSFAQTIPKDGLIGYYNFDQAPDTVVKDQSGNGLDGVIVGGAEWTEGIRGGGMLFNGVDSYVNIGVHPEFDIEYGITLAA